MEEWIERLLIRGRLAENSILCYASTLRYWYAWHALRFGVPFPLSYKPAQAIPSATLLAFFADHAAVAISGRVTETMAPHVAVGLRQAGFRVGVNCMSPTNIISRVRVLERTHLNLNLPFPSALIAQWKPQFLSEWEVARTSTAPGLGLPPTATQTLSALLAACDATRMGLFTAALVVLSQRLTTSQLCKLRFLDLRAGTVDSADGPNVVVELTIKMPISTMQRLSPLIRFFGYEAQHIVKWGALRQEEFESDGWFMGAPAYKTPKPLSQNSIVRYFRTIAKDAGLVAVTGQPMASPRWLRLAYEREFRHDFTAYEIALAARSGIKTAENLVRASFSKGDHNAR